MKSLDGPAEKRRIEKMESILDEIRERLARMSREELEELNRLLDRVGLRKDARPESHRSDPAPGPAPAREDF